MCLRVSSLKVKSLKVRRIAKVTASRRKSVLRRLTFLLLLAQIAGCESDHTRPDEVLVSGNTMGTYYAVKYFADECTVSKAQFDDVLADINQSMSTYDPTSELSIINQQQSTDWLTMSTQLKQVMDAAKDVWVMSEGAFDVTIGPLVNLWGFGATTPILPEDNTDGPSPQAQLLAAEKVGMQKLEFEGTRLRKAPGMYIDLSALAKGYGVDQLAELLSASACRNFMVDVGGEMRLAGRNARHEAWRIGIETPLISKLGEIKKVLELQDVGVATSGDYRNFRLVDGKPVDHVIDPRSAQPANNLVVSATVVHESAMWADALATTMMVLGVEDALAFATQHNLAVLLIARSAQSDHLSQTNTQDIRFTEHLSETMKQYLVSK